MIQDLLCWPYRLEGLAEMKIKTSFLRHTRVIEPEGGKIAAGQLVKDLGVAVGCRESAFVGVDGCSMSAPSGAMAFAESNSASFKHSFQIPSVSTSSVRNALSTSCLL